MYLVKHSPHSCAPLRLALALIILYSCGLSQTIHDLDSLNLAGSKLYKRGNYRQALEKHYAALKIAKALQEENRIAETFGLLAQAEIQLDLFDSVAVHANRMLAIARTTKNSRFESTALRTLADVYSRCRKYPEATRFYTDAARIAEEIPDSAEMAIIYGNLGNVYGDTGQFDTALTLYHKSLVLNRVLHVPRRVADALQNIGITHVQQGRLPQALAYLDSAQTIFTLLNDDVSVGRTLTILGSVYDEQGAFPRGIEALQHALAIAEKTQIPSDIAYALGNMGIHYWNVGEYAKTAHYFSRANVIFEQLCDDYNASVTYTNLGALYTSVGDYAQALSCLQRALRIKEKLSELPGIAIVYSTIGTVYAEQGRLQQAKTFLNKSLTMCRRIGDTLTTAKVHIALADILLREKNFQLSERHIADGINLFRAHGVRTQVAGALVSLGLLRMAERRLPDAARCFDDALSIANEINSPEWKWKAHAGLGAIHEEQSAWDEARHDYALAVNELEQVRTMIEAGELRTTFVQSQISPYESLIRVLARLHTASPTKVFADTTFVVLERFKARSFVELLAESRADVRRGLSEEQKLQEHALLNHISKIQSRLIETGMDRSAREHALEDLKVAEDELLQLQSEFRRTNPAYANLKYPSPIDVQTVQSQILSEGDLLLEFSLGSKRSYLWLITKDSSRLVELPSAATIERQARVFLSELRRRPTSATLTGSLSAIRSAGTSLFKTLFGNWAKEVLSARNLIIVPDGILFYLPFEALPLPSASGYLINRLPVSYAPSATVLVQLCARPDSARPPLDLLAFGDPTFARKQNGNHPVASTTVRAVDIFKNLTRDVTPLPLTRKEIHDIASHCSSDKTTLHLGNEATETDVKKEELFSYRYIHFATHGILDENVPSRSGLLLSTVDDSTEDGILQMNEILNLEMDADLVVLSACETGLGKLMKGEGMVGLTRAFHYAGARSLVVSLWKVADNSTAALMDGLYANLVKSHTPPEALREAKLNMLKSSVPTWRHPYHWAGFVVQ
jgi:CHAT domain-containing protein/Tfp pilus assembly protein PilF